MTTSVGVKIGAANSVVAVAGAGTTDQLHTVATTSLTSVRNMVHQVGDPVPVIEDDGASVFPEVLYTETVIDVLRHAGTPDGPITLVYPDGWSDFAVESTARVVGEASADLAGPGLPAAVLVPEAIATLATLPDATGTHVIYDLGASGLRVTVVSAGPEPAILGRPLFSADVGGDEFDHSLLTHLLLATGTADALDPATIDDPDVVESLRVLRGACRDAREELSAATAATVEITLPGVHTEARVVRAELEDLLRGPITDSVSLITAAIASCDLRVDDISGVVLTGGVAATPLVSEIIAAQLPIPPTLVDQPVTQSALGGAALAATRNASVAPPAPVVPVPASAAAPAAVRELVPAPRGSAQSAAKPVSWRRRIIIGAAASCAAAVAAVALATSTGVVGGTHQTQAPTANADTPTSSTRAPHHDSTTPTTSAAHVSSRRSAAADASAPARARNTGAPRTTAATGPRTPTPAPRTNTTRAPAPPANTAPPTADNPGGSTQAPPPQPPEDTGQAPNRVPDVGGAVCGVTRVLCP